MSVSPKPSRRRRQESSSDRNLDDESVIGSSVSLRDKVFDLKKEEILRVAGELFFFKGYTHTSLDDIASELRIGKPLIYACFPSKTALLAEVCTRTTITTAEIAAGNLKKSASPTERLRHTVREVTNRVIEGRINLGVLFREVKHLPPEAVQELSRSFHLFNHSLQQLLEEGVQAGEFSISDEGTVTLAISGMMTWIYSWYRPEGRLNPDQVADQMAQLALRMVGAHAEGGAQMSSPISTDAGI